MPSDKESVSKLVLGWPENAVYGHRLAPVVGAAKIAEAGNLGIKMVRCDVHAKPLAALERPAQDPW